MKKILLAIAAVAVLVGCTKDVPNENENQNEKAVTIRFSPYEMSPMSKTTSSVATVCSRLDIYIIENGTTDTLRFHQERTATADFGSITTTLQTNRTYKLVAVAHNSTDTCTLSSGIVSFAEDKIKQTLYADTTFSPADGLSLNVVMQRIVGMFKMRVTDQIPSDVTGFRFTVNQAGCKFNTATHESTDRGLRLHTINGTSTDANGVAIYNVYIMADNMTDVLYVDIEAEAVNPANDGEVRQFTGVPIRDGYLTTYTGTFFVSFDMGFTFLVGDWNDGGSFNF